MCVCVSVCGGGRGQDNKWSETARAAKKSNQGPIKEPTQQQMDNLFVRSFNERALRGKREGRLRRFPPEYGQEGQLAHRAATV